MINPGTLSFIPVGATARALQSISQQNNVGASLYNQGNYAEAVQVFKQAISASMIFLIRPPEEVEPYRTSVEQCLSVLVLPSQTAHTYDFGSTKHPTIYAKTFDMAVTLVNKGEASCDPLMTLEGTDANGEHYVLFSKLSTILIYNLALTHHVLALVSGGSDSRKGRECLSKARDLYSQANSIPQREQKQEIIDANLLPLFVQSILNNLGQCYASLDDTVNSVACFELLLKSVILFQQDLNGAHNSGAYDNRLYYECSNTCFLENTLFLILKDQGFAPAA
ncbi:tetratricopeptide repeat protein [Nitzschia inconspicua]|uniref:Tetratricopeptide repeat protein n=1 Tax=Nitzschia inconspicua TaxID=303405 RepID=A0A9K3PLD3_9STRA|nr:tetratricopeptide repeat protein [Nitzschia inconspicua]